MTDVIKIFVYASAADLETTTTACADGNDGKCWPVHAATIAKALFITYVVEQF